MSGIVIFIIGMANIVPTILAVLAPFGLLLYPVVFIFIVSVISIAVIDLLGEITVSIWMKYISYRTDYENPHYDMNKGFFYFITQSEKINRL